MYVTPSCKGVKSAMTVSVLSAAKRLGETSGWILTNLHMQKMCYIAHMSYLGKTNEPLVSGDFEAWDYGPVHPELYHFLKGFGRYPVKASAFVSIDSIPEDCLECKYLDAAVEQLDRHKLIQITHWKRGAWSKVYLSPVENGIITKSDILNEYNARRAARSNQQ